MNQRRWFPFWLWILSLLWIFGRVLGCSAVTGSIPPMSAPFFSPTSEEKTRAAILSRELDAKALRCLECQVLCRCSLTEKGNDVIRFALGVFHFRLISVGA